MLNKTLMNKFMSNTRRSMRTLLIGLCFTFGFFSNLHSQGFLKTDGQSIINDEGPILLRGLNLGNWLVNEGYLMEMHPAADAPWEIKEKLIEMIGETYTDQFFTIYRDNYIQERDIDTIAKLGFNHVRLPFHYNLICPEEKVGTFSEEGFKYLDHAIKWCKKRGLYVILDMHCVPGAANSAGHGDSRGSNDFWHDEDNQLLFYDLWKTIARRYKDEPWVGGYDLVNESVNVADQPENKLMLSVFKKATQEIRSVDKKHILFFEGNWYASDFRGLTPPWDNNMVYSFHKYWVPNTVEHMQYLFDIQEDFNIPLWLGEAGENSNNWYASHVKLLETHNIGWCWWTYKKPNSITAPFVLNFTPGWHRLKKYWKKGIDAPSKEYMTSALLKFASSTNLDYCSFNPDVYEALMRPDFLEKSTPWPLESHAVPCTKSAASFDTGGQNVAYSDINFETNSNNPFQSWNDNWTGRNDGVEMFKNNDSLNTSNFVVTGIENNEWINYTFSSEKNQDRVLKIRYASPHNNGIVSVYLDNKIVAKKISLPSTAGKWNWVEKTLATFNFPEGTHTIKLKFPSGGVSLSTITLE